MGRSPGKSPPAPDNETLPELIARLHDIRRRITRLAGDGLDAVADEHGTAWLLPDAQEQLRASEAESRHFASLRGDIIDALPAQIAVLDESGIIVAVNSAWRSFAVENGVDPEHAWEGVDYLAACRGTGDKCESLEGLDQALVDAIAGKPVEFSGEYPCHAPGQQRWFRCTVAPLHSPEPGAVVMHTEITERKLAELSLRDSEQRLQQVFESITAGIVVTDPSGVIDQTNRAFQEMLGMDRARLRGQPLRALVHPQDRDEAEAVLARLDDYPGQPVAGELRFIHHTGKTLWVRFRFSTPDPVEGQPRRPVAVTEDITAQRQTEARLQRSETLRRLAGRIGRIGGWALDPTTGEAYWSAELFELLEWPSEKPPVFSESSGLYGDRELERMQEAIEKCRTTGEPFELDMQMLTARGREIMARIGGQAETDVQGNVVRIVGAFQDITESHRAEEARRNIEERLQSTLDNMSDAFYLLDRDWCFVYLNRMALDLMRRPAEDLLGMEILEEFPELRETIVPERFRQAAAENRSMHFELHFAPLENWFEVNVHPNPEGLAVYFRTVTKERELEAQLRQAQRLESVGQLTGGIAHDFNNLLTVIIGNAELLGEALDDEDPGRPLAAMISSAAQRGAGLTQRLLAFARRQPLAPQSVQINDLITSMEALLLRTLGENIEVRTRLAADLAPATVDPAQLESALLNLCLNARDAMPEGGTLTIATRGQHPGDDDLAGLELEPGEYVELSVSDCGTGIPPEDLERIFEPFFTTKETGKGTGLGLSMVYGFVRQSGGEIRVESESGAGTCVRIFLPRSHETRIAAADTAPARESTRSMPGARILLVEDDELVRQYAARQLGSLGYRVVEAANGAQALDLIEEDRAFDLLLTDIVMPGGIDGPEVARQARQSIPGLGVLFSSGYAEAAFVRNGQFEEGTRLLGKPYRRAELAARVREVLDDH